MVSGACSLVEVASRTLAHPASTTREAMSRGGEVWRERKWGRRERRRKGDGLKVSSSSNEMEVEGRRWLEEGDGTHGSGSRDSSDSVFPLLLSLEAVENDEGDFLAYEEDSKELACWEGVSFFLSLRGPHSRSRDSSEMEDPERAEGKRELQL